MNWKKPGQRVAWQYTHHLNSKSTTEIVKYGTIVEITGKIKNKRYVSGSHAKIKFDTNKNPCIKPLSELKPI